MNVLAPQTQRHESGFLAAMLNKLTNKLGVEAFTFEPSAGKAETAGFLES